MVCQFGYVLVVTLKIWYNKGKRGNRRTLSFHDIFAQEFSDVVDASSGKMLF